MKPTDFSKLLSEEQCTQLTSFIEKKLPGQLSEFELFYGYKPNKLLAYWLIMNELSNDNIEYDEKDGTFMYFMPDNPWLPDTKTYVHNIHQFTYSEFIEVLTPFVQIGQDGRGGQYFTGFFQPRNEVAYLDLDPFWVFRLSKTVKSLTQIHPMAQMPAVLKKADKIISELTGENMLQYKNDCHYSINNMGRRAFPLWRVILCISEADRIGLKKTDLLSLSNSLHALKSKREERFSKIDAEYVSCENVRAITNAFFAKAFYLYYFNNQKDQLAQVLDETAEIQGVYYQQMRKTFQQVLAGDMTNMKIAEDKLAVLLS